MAWRSHGKSHVDLITQLRVNGVITSPYVEEAMRQVDRGLFCSHNPYQDCPQSIGYQATISAPHMHAHALQVLASNLKEGCTILDVGSGSGYLTACMAMMVGSSGKVYGIEHIPELISLSRNNINKFNPSLLESDRIQLIVGDGRLGYELGAPFDAIHVGAAAPVTPNALIEQLKPGGNLIIPVGPAGGNQHLEQYTKHADGSVTKKSLMSVIYVPLTSKDSQLNVSFRRS
ncbi:uncharacterized protein TRIADDRAFT_49594 [Trichoplax adhaerens]|uniref:Protein-L-isoaspartate O-methyltransferase n=1 Tax=Trichoplax adhaerens TaxID=10228 RepID=B3RJQ6_TRIAD|nr:hypothetical protein TRIADDRAFT_49594 [Trichoplax adhaerens]EDV29335.1 hypothetical protein TRIADDRAFT_49594 [Trichoplax adhaerens]|eukprot:XP_002108537.1 hypothetical protein TRIADDRAFT_49594 [Trichoplax adhaerens]